MSQHPILSLSHIGICCADLERSLTFYTEGLGFTLAGSIEEIGPPFDVLMEMPGAKCRAHFITHGGTKLELIGYPGSTVTGSAERRPLNQRGFTHFTLIVADLDAAVARVVSHGGAVHPETRIESPFGPLVFCTDPDGVRIEMLQATR